MWASCISKFLGSAFHFNSQQPAIMPETIVNKKWILVQYPKGPLDVERDLKLVEETIDLDSLPLEPNEVAVRTEAFSVDAFVRTLLEEENFHGGGRTPGSTLLAAGFGTVVKAGSNEAYKVGSRVLGIMQVSNIAIVPKSPMVNTLMLLPGVKLSLSLGLMGISGMSAYFGVFSAPSRGPQKGETVVVSAAAGSVGSIAAQMAKLAGARVVGIAGGPQKTKFLLEDLHLDAAIDYKDSQKSLSDKLAEACPNGIDFYFDNVGGDTLNTVLEKINQGARIVICGAISQYDTGKMYTDERHGPSNYLKLAERNASMSGFNLGHYISSPKNLFTVLAYLMWHYHRGNLKAFEHFENGIECFGKGLEMLLSGGHIGRLIIDVDGNLSKP